MNRAQLHVFWPAFLISHVFRWIESCGSPIGWKHHQRNSKSVFGNPSTKLQRDTVDGSSKEIAKEGEDWLPLRSPPMSSVSLLRVHESSQNSHWFWQGLDPPLLLYLLRLILRTFMRLFRLHEPCSVGCFERPSEVFFSKESIIWWCLSQHWIRRKHYAARMQDIGLEGGRNVERRRMRRFGGWGSSLKNWLAEVEHMVRSQHSENTKAAWTSVQRCTSSPGLFEKKR